MTERDPKVSARYRELAREEPPPHVDDAILAAARHSMRKKARRWYYPVAIAAVLLLAVAVTVQIERGPRVDEVAQAPVVPTETPSEAPARSEPQAQKFPTTPEVTARREAAPLADLQKAPAPAAEPAASARAEARIALGAAAASPEQWLQGIADLRRQGRDDEAERQLEDFRKRYPDYRIAPEMLERLKKR